MNFWLWQYIRSHLALGCSREQIAGRLRHEYSDDTRKHLSTETIDAALNVLTRGILPWFLREACKAACLGCGEGSTGPDTMQRMKGDAVAFDLQ